MAVHRRDHGDQRFRVGAEFEDWGFLGVFLGTCSAFAYAALCRVPRRVRPLRCGFAAVSTVDGPLHRACPVLPYAHALLNVFRPSTLLAVR
jgi:hypothetical protein